MDKSERRRWKAGGTGAAAAAVALGGAVLLSVALTPECEDRGCPTLGELERYRPPEAVRVYDGRDARMGQLPGPRRFVVPLASIPEVLREGYVAVEDRRFRSHGGVDARGFLRALRTNLRAGRIEEGASTITMQLVRNAFGPDLLEWNKFRRKLAEVALALEVEEQLDKDEILELYLNQIYLGDGVYGVDAAARHYFGKPVSDVTDREAALLIGLAKNPEGYDPHAHPRAAEARIRTVLAVLRREEVLSRERAIAARWEAMDLPVRRPAADWGDDAYYLSAVRRELRAMIPDPAERSGLRVFTGLDRAAQSAAVHALRAQIERIEAGRFGPFEHAAPGDSLPVDVRTGSPWLQGMVVAMEPGTGLVTTLVGGRDYRHSEFDRAFQARRQPGSAFKPIVYAEALESGARLHHALSTRPVRLDAPGSEPWEPADHVEGNALSLRDALVLSSNTVTVRVGMELGPARVAERARRLGIHSDLPLYPSLYLGAGEVVPAELVAAYATFGNGGRSVRPHLIRRIEDPSGTVLFRQEADTARALDPRMAYLMLDALQDVVRRGTGWRAGGSGVPGAVAGKTGTTDGSRDAWFIGLTPGRVAGVWLGFDRPRTIVPDAEGGTLAAPVWASFMAAAPTVGPTAAPGWSPPEGVMEVRFDPHSGFHLPEGCRAPGSVRTEWALAEAPPLRYCPYEVAQPRERWIRNTAGGAPRIRIGGG